MTACHAINVEDCWVTHLSNWFKTLVPGTNAVNAAIPASTSALSALCLADLMPANVDIVFVEFAVNDNNGSDDFHGGKTYMNNTLRRGFERLLRKILLLQSSPAVIVVHYFSPVWAQHSFGSDSFWMTPEDEMNVLAMYYDVDVVSWRNAYYHLYRAGIDGFSSADVLVDGVHPSAAGHWHLTYLVQYHMNALLQNTRTAKSGTVQQIPAPMFDENNEATTVCLRGDNLLNAVQPGNDFEYTSGDKAGFIPLKAAAALHLQLDAHPAGIHTVYLGVLLLGDSENIGLDIDCTDSCLCESPSTIVRAQSAGHQQQLSNAGSVHIQGACRLTIIVTADLKSGVPNCKLMSVIIGSEGLQQQDMIHLGELS